MEGDAGTRRGGSNPELNPPFNSKSGTEEIWEMAGKRAGLMGQRVHPAIDT